MRRLLIVFHDDSILLRATGAVRPYVMLHVQLDGVSDGLDMTKCFLSRDIFSRGRERDDDALLATCIHNNVINLSYRSSNLSLYRRN